MGDNPRLLSWESCRLLMGFLRQGSRIAGIRQCLDPIPGVLAAIALSLADYSRTENALSTARRNRTFVARTNTLVVPG